MIDHALSYIARTLNRYLSNKFDLEADPVVLNNLVESNGTPPLKNQNKMVFTLINLEHETAKQYYGGYVPSTDPNTTSKTQPSIRFNLDLLLTANFDVYEEALKFLSSSIAFFQATPCFARSQFPDMPRQLEQLQFEIENASYEKTHNLWSALGAKYQPSIIYKVRHVSIDAAQIDGEVAQVQGIQSEVNP